MTAGASRVIVITGGSRGIGAATARLAAERGYDVCIGYRANQAAGEDVVRAVARTGRRAVAVRADVTVESDIVALFETAARTLGPVTALVNNAGIVAPQTRVEDMSVERLRRMFEVNVIGAFVCAREAVRRMSTKHGGPGGAIVNVSSAASRVGSANEYVDYAASKAAIDTLTLGLAQEVAEEGIRVNAVRPGFIYTEIHALGGEPERVDRVKAFVPMKRGGHPDEVARAILWLLSDEASYTTGYCLDVAGGR